MGEERFWRMLRRRVMPALISVAAVLVSIAAVVFIVDTARGDDDDGDARSTLRFAAAGELRLDELLERLGIDGLEGLDALDLDRLGEDLPELARALAGGPLLGIEFSVEDGAILVEDVQRGSPADEAGLEPGDVIERVEGERVSSGAELREALAAVEPGDDYRMTVNRNGRRSTIDLERPELAASSLERLLDEFLGGLGRDLGRDFDRRSEEVPVPRVAPREPPGEPGPPLLGVTTVQTDEGVRVASVLPGLGADEAGIEPGDLLIAINGEPIRSTQQLRELLRGAHAGEVVGLVIGRDGREEQVHVRLSEAPQASGEFRFSGPDGVERGFELRPNGEGGFEFRGPNGEDLSPLLEGLPPELQERLARIIAELFENGISPLIPRGDGQLPSGA